jgi:transcriptional regulator of acetoin/glycerol metabolism
MAVKQTNWKDVIVDLLLKKQGYICPLCEVPFALGELFEVDHIISKANGGDDSVKNMRVVHPECHTKRHHPKARRIRNTVRDIAVEVNGTLREVTDKFTTLSIQNTLKEHGGNVSRAARQLGVSRPTLYERMKKLRISRG